MGNLENLIKDCQTEANPHRSSYIGGLQVWYKLPNGYELSCVNSHMLHSYPFAWEIAVFTKNRENLTYDTSLTDDVKVCFTDEEANDFIREAIEWAKGGE